MEGSISFKKELLEMGTPTEYALTVAMRSLNHEFKDLKSLVENGDIPKSTARTYLKGIAKLNNQLVDRYNFKGDASGYFIYLEDGL
tara:strand:+ start:356 stop:613 length:258 start_codon:yes stop_codon:yes gene_type:complete